jgi:hypothetical protein
MPTNVFILEQQSSDMLTLKWGGWNPHLSIVAMIYSFLVGAIKRL